MRKIYFKIFVSIIVVLWIIYFIQTYTSSINNEGFTPKINSLYRPYVRHINNKYETFINNYGPNIIINKLKKFNIY
jgi:hypothetical protein